MCTGPRLPLIEGQADRLSFEDATEILRKKSLKPPRTRYDFTGVDAIIGRPMNDVAKYMGKLFKCIYERTEGSMIVVFHKKISEEEFKDAVKEFVRERVLCRKCLSKDTSEASGASGQPLLTCNVCHYSRLYDDALSENGSSEKGDI